MLETTTMMSTPPNDRQTSDLQNAESCTVWIMPFVAKCCAEKKEDKVNNDGTIVDLQVTNLFLSECGQGAVLKLRSLMSPKNLLDTPFKEIRQPIQNYISPKEIVERAKFLSVVQGIGETDDDFLAFLREEARYCGFEKLKTVTNPEEELLKINFISGLRDLEAFASQAMAFASSSTGNRPFVIKEDTTSKRPSENLVKSSLVKKAMVTCVIDVEVSHTVASRVRLRTKNVTSVKRWGTLQKCAEVKPSLSQVSLTNTTIFARKRVSCLVKHHSKWRWECTMHGKTCLTCQWHRSTLQ